MDPEGNFSFMKADVWMLVKYQGCRNVQHFHCTVLSLDRGTTRKKRAAVTSPNKKKTTMTDP
jgi:hypothetical protein